jgi:hypothetical protein
MKRLFGDARVGNIVAIVALVVALAGTAWGGSSLGPLNTQEQFMKQMAASLAQIKSEPDLAKSFTSATTTTLSEIEKQKALQKQLAAALQEVADQKKAAQALTEMTNNASNLPAYQAALGNTIEKLNAVISEQQIKLNSLTNKVIDQGTLKNIEKCSAPLHGPVGDLCFTDPHPAANWDDAQIGCSNENRRLPTITEGALIGLHGGLAPGEEFWTDELFGDGAFGAITVATIVGGIELPAYGDATAVNKGYRCVIKAQSGT